MFVQSGDYGGITGLLGTGHMAELFEFVTCLDHRRTERMTVQCLLSGHSRICSRWPLRIISGNLNNLARQSLQEWRATIKFIWETEINIYLYKVGLCVFCDHFEWIPYICKVATYLRMYYIKSLGNIFFNAILRSFWNLLIDRKFSPAEPCTTKWSNLFYHW